MVIKRLFSALCVFAITTLWLSSALAHHSHGNYHMTQYLNLEGTVNELQWLNPHTWIYLDVVNDEGEVDIWALEGASPSQLMSDGWTADSIKAGDHIKVRCHQLRDGANGCLLGFVTPPGGEEKEWD
jgi:hypothetical protein